MQKIVNVIAIASGAVSIALIGSGLFVYVNRDSMVDDRQAAAIDAALDHFGLGGSLLETNDLAAPSVGSPLVLRRKLAVPKKPGPRNRG